MKIEEWGSGERSGANDQQQWGTLFLKSFIVLLPLGRCATTPPSHPATKHISHLIWPSLHKSFPYSIGHTLHWKYWFHPAAALIARKPFTTVTNRKWKNKPRVCFDCPQWRILELWSQTLKKGDQCEDLLHKAHVIETLRQHVEFKLK